MNSTILVFALPLRRRSPFPLNESTPTMWFSSQLYSLMRVVYSLVTIKTNTRWNHFSSLLLLKYVCRSLVLGSMENGSRTHRTPVLGYVETVWKFSVKQLHAKCLRGHIDINLRVPAKTFSHEVRKRFQILVLFAKRRPRPSSGHVVITFVTASQISCSCLKSNYQVIFCRD